MESDFGCKPVLATIPPWIPEDDLLLKNSIEAGASLEALAKGAVRFSRKYSVQELQNRWHSLLYDPVVSAKASACMGELEHSTSNILPKFNKSGNNKGSLEITSKRTSESVRKMYYTMRKRACSRPSNTPSLDFICSPDFDIKDHGGFEEPLKPSPNNLLLEGHSESQFACLEIDEGMRHHGPQNISSKGIVKNEFPVIPSLLAKEKQENNNPKHTNEHGGSHILGKNSNSQAVTHSMNYSASLPGIPVLKTEDMSASTMEIDTVNQCAEKTTVLPDDLEGRQIKSSEHVASSGPMLEFSHINGEQTSSNVISEREYVDLPESLLNCTNDPIVYMDTDSKEAVDKSSYDSLNLLLLNSPNDVYKDNAPDLTEPHALVSETCTATSDVPHSEEMEVTVDHHLHSDKGHEDNIVDSEAKILSSTSAQYGNHPIVHGEVIVCILNTEDPDIPCNNHFPPSNVCSYPIIQASNRKGKSAPSFSANHKDCEQDIYIRKKEHNPTHTFGTPSMAGSDLLLQKNVNHLHASGVKPEVLDGNQFPVLSKQANIAVVDLNKGRAANSIPYSAAGGVLIKDPLHACKLTDLSLHTEASSITNTVLEPSSNRAVSDEDCESDDEIPCFADIEAMILGMDLCPDDSDPFLNRNVARYQHEDAKRTIIRLEQSARASMRRAIASKGALAILYGHHLKHYIRKAEVIIGRATSDVGVDIDLGREGRANKVSRRQALVRMEENGSFSLKNLGKALIFINGKEIATGQIISLTSSSLIEIRGMSFMFEINKKSVGKYLMNLTKKKQAKFEWSEEKVS